jgi:Flp pilus assembly protein CpaB
VILTYTQEGNLKSKIIVENARVLSLGGDSRSLDERMGALKKVESQRTITLEVTPQDALKVQTSMQLGTLALVMRAPEDDRAPIVTEVGANQIDSSYGSRNQIQKQTCSKGTMRVGGKEYLVDCDGSLTQVLNPEEP